jgi:membrane protein YdbS with pleckstrin-like domain
MLAAWSFLEWFFAAVLVFLVGAVAVFFLYMITTLFVNPARRNPH